MNENALLLVHQLLGRVVYFHALFIEPATAFRRTAPVVLPRSPCCNHSLVCGGGRVSVSGSLRESAWQGIDEIAESLAVLGGCSGDANQCCATCRIMAVGATVGLCWPIVELDAYGMAQPDPSVLLAWCRMAGVQLARAFAAQFNTSCFALEHGLDSFENVPPPSSMELPLTSELMALWAQPEASKGAPIVSWLNHCADLDDVARMLASNMKSEVVSECATDPHS